MLDGVLLAATADGRLSLRLSVAADGYQIREATEASNSLETIALPNWAMKTFQPAPTARSASPKAAVVLPLPSPV